MILKILLLFFVNVYSIDNTFYQLNKEITQRINFGAVYTDNHILLAGGQDINGNYLDTIEKCSHKCLITNYTLSSPRKLVSSIYLKKYNLALFISGFEQNSITLSNVIDIFNITSHNMTSLIIPITFYTSYGNIQVASFDDTGTIFLIQPNGVQILYSYNIFTGILTEVMQSVNFYTISSFPEKNKLFLTGLNQDDFSTNLYLFNETLHLVKTINLNFNFEYATSFPSDELVVLTDGIDIAVFNSTDYSFFYDKNPFANYDSITSYSVAKQSKNGIFYIYGGTIGNNNIQNTISVYDIYQKIWSKHILDVPLMNAVPVDIIIGIYFIGGYTTNNIISQQISILSYASAGYYQHIQKDSNMTACQGGTYCPAGTVFYTGCGQGFYCPPKSYQPTPCPAGTFNQNAFSSSLSQCQKCPLGTFNIFVQQISLNSCIQCSIGFYCPIATPIPIPCPSNYYCPNPNQQIPCPTGTYNSGTNAISVDSCIKCQKGFFCSGNGNNAGPCEPGSFSDKFGNAKCNDCPAGNSCPYGAITPQPCPVNYYAPKGSSACTPCSNGEITKDVGASECISCPSSRFSLDGWWCMNTFEKLVFLGVWIGSIASGILTFWNIYSFIKIRLNKIREEGYKPTVKTFIFLEKMNRRNINLTDIVEEKPILQEDQLKKINEIISELKEKIILIENKN